MKFLIQKKFFRKYFKLSNKFGLNSTSIADITKIPRTTVLRKLAKLEKLNILKKDKFKRYETQDLINGSDYSRKTIYPLLTKHNKAIRSSYLKMFRDIFFKRNENYLIRPYIS